MFKNKLLITLFFLILLIATGLRLYKISDIPPGVNRDEASIGYTAYSLIHTGRDEYKRSFPLSFESFGDWKLPVYIYETVGSVKFLGLNELAVRLPSALVGIATVGLVFFLVREMFQTNDLAFLTMFLLAIAPWSIHFSRVESESNTAVFLVTLASFLFLKSLKKVHWLIIPSSILFALTYFTYAGNYVFTTLLILGLALFYRKYVAKTKYLFYALGFFLLLTVSMWFITTSANHTKLSGISIFSDPSVVNAQIEIPRNQHSNPNSFLVRILHNRIVFATQRFSQNFLNSYSPQFLFISGGTNKAHNIENFGNMYLIEAPFLFLGILFLFSGKKGKERNLVLWWFFIAAIAPSITKDAPHTNRMFAIFPILPLVVSFGIIHFVSWTKKYKLLTIFTMIILFTLNIGLYLDRYYTHFPINESQNWGIEYKNLYNFLQTTVVKNKHVIMTQPQTSPYIYFLFYGRYDPKKYQQTALRYGATEDGFVHVKSFDRYEFRDIDWKKDLSNPNNLIIENSEKVPSDIRKAYKSTDIVLPSGTSMFTIISGQ